MSNRSFASEIFNMDDVHEHVDDNLAVKSAVSYSPIAESKKPVFPISSLGFGNIPVQHVMLVESGVLGSEVLGEINLDESPDAGALRQRVLEVLVQSNMAVNCWVVHVSATSIGDEFLIHPADYPDWKLFLLDLCALKVFTSVMEKGLFEKLLELSFFADGPEESDPHFRYSQHYADYSFLQYPLLETTLVQPKSPKEKPKVRRRNCFRGRARCTKRTGDLNLFIINPGPALEVEEGEDAEQ